MGPVEREPVLRGVRVLRRVPRAEPPAQRRLGLARPAARGAAVNRSFLSPLPVFRERVRVRACPKPRATPGLDKPSPRPSPGVPGEGETPAFRHLPSAWRLVAFAALALQLTPV